MQATIRAMFAEWSKALQIERLKADLSKVANDINKIKDSIAPQTAKTLAQAEKKYKEIVNKISLAQNQWKSEAKKAAVLMKKTSKEVELTLMQYKKIADKQKTDLKNSLAAKTKTTAKGAAPAKKSKNSKAVKSGVKAKSILKSKSPKKAKSNIKVKPLVNAKQVSTPPTVGTPAN